MAFSTGDIFSGLWMGLFPQQASPPKTKQLPLPSQRKSSVSPQRRSSRISKLSPRRSPRLKKDDSSPVTSRSTETSRSPIKKKQQQQQKKTVRFDISNISKSPSKFSREKNKNFDDQSIIMHIKDKIDNNSRSDRSLRIKTSQEQKRAITPPKKTLVNRKDFITDEAFNMLRTICERYESDLNKEFKKDKGVNDLLVSIKKKNRTVCLEDLNKLVIHLFHFLNKKN